MTTDTMNRIYPELRGTRRAVTLTLSSTGPVTVYADQGEIDLSTIAVTSSDTTLALPNGQVYTLRLCPIDRSDPLYFDVVMRGLGADALALARDIRTLAQNTANQPRRDLTTEISAYASRVTELYRQLDEVPNPEDSQSVLSAIQSANAIQSQVEGEGGGAVPRRRQDIHRAVVQRVKRLRRNTTDKKAGVRAVIALCDSGVTCLRLGGLSTDIERDYMEVLGAGGFKHWTDKKKAKVTNRALEQANPDSIIKADEKVEAILARYASTEDAQSEEEAQRTCWLTMMTEEDLLKEGDILCLAGYIRRGDRNLPLCSVSSSKVLNNSILNNRVEICPQPMSFLTLRQLLLEGNQIARGPVGQPINACICLLPKVSSPNSAEISFCYSALAASQLLTSRWIYTTVRCFPHLTQNTFFPFLSVYN
jgi:hypothetical protein